MLDFSRVEKGGFLHCFERLALRGGGGSCAPEEVDGRDGPVAPIILNVIAQAGGLPMGEVIPPDHVHRHGVHPGEPGHLHDDSTGPTDPVNHPVPHGYPAVRERLDIGREGPEPTEAGGVRIPPLPRHIIA
jgi:hypothetical protein